MMLYILLSSAKGRDSKTVLIPSFSVPEDSAGCHTGQFSTA